MLVAPDIPGLAGAHADAVLADLGDGIALTVGAAHDGRPYLVALAANDPELIELAGGSLEALFRAAAERDLAISMIRHERRLASAADARALVARPAFPAGARRPARSPAAALTCAPVAASGRTTV